jgi:hypothetical protein
VGVVEIFCCSRGDAGKRCREMGVERQWQRGEQLLVQRYGRIPERERECETSLQDVCIEELTSLILNVV